MFDVPPTDSCAVALRALADGRHAALAPRAQPRAAVAEAGYYRVILTAASTRLSITTTDDVRTGDPISGTMALDPAGPPRMLEELFVCVPGAAIPVRAGTFRWTAPAFWVGLTVPVVLADCEGRVLGTAALPILALPPESRPPPDPSAGITLTSSRKGRAGTLVQLLGNFDGDAGTTRVSVRGVHVPVIAESPRKVIVRLPASEDGPALVRVVEGGASDSVRVRIAPTRGVYVRRFVYPLVGLAALLAVLVGVSSAVRGTASARPPS